MLLLVTLHASGVVGQQRREVPRPASDPYELAAVRSLLAADDPAIIARGALRVRDGMLHELIPELRGILCNLPLWSDLPMDRRGLCAPPESLACVAVLDALDRLGARVPAAELLPRLDDVYPRDPALCLLLRAPDRDEVLLDLIRAAYDADDPWHGWSPVEHAAGNLLSLAEQPDPAWVRWLLETSHARLDLYISGLTPKSGHVSIGSCGEITPDDFPTIASWQIVAARPDDETPSRLLAPGIHPVWARRVTIRATEPAPYCTARPRPVADELRAAWLTTAAGLGADRQPELWQVHRHEFDDAAGVRAAIEAARAEWRSSWQPVFAGLRARGLLGRDPDPHVETPPVLQIHDGRRDRTEPLPLPPGTRLAPARRR